MRDSAPSVDAAARPARGALPLAARVGAVVWPSFFAAGVATMVFFAIVDPVELSEITWTQTPVSRELGYTIGFFMFWACTFSASLFTALLLSPSGDHEVADDSS
jgi:hypothetical protein